MKKQKVLVVGGGFGGVKAALELSDDEHFDVTLLSDQAQLRYYPTLYHVATGGKRSNSAIDLNRIFEGKDVTILHGTAVTLDRRAKTVTTDKKQPIPYDVLILSLGVVTNYFGIPGLAEYSHSIKSVEGALKLKAHLHQQLIDENRPDLNYVIIGAGPTGIELAGAIPEYMKEIMANHGIKRRAVRVSLIEAAPRLLPRMPKSTSRTVARQLRRLGVKIHVGKTVQGQDADSLTVDGQPLPSKTVVWTAGVTNHPFFKENNFVLMPRGKVATDVYLQTEDSIYVLGDNANTPYSGLAQTALRDGMFVARNLKRAAAGKTMKPYKPVMPATVIPAGRRWAVVTYGALHLSGMKGWLFREAADLIGFHDYEAWPRATRQWLTEFEFEEECRYCY